MKDATPQVFPKNQKYTIFPDGRVLGPKGKFLKPRKNRQGYLRFSASVDGQCKDFYIHRAVCELFVGPCPSPDHQVDHINSNRADNDARNLRWVTKKENLADRRQPQGERHWRCRLSDDDVRRIRAAEGSQSQIARQFNVARETVRDIRNGKERRYA